MILLQSIIYFLFSVWIMFDCSLWIVGGLNGRIKDENSFFVNKNQQKRKSASLTKKIFSDLTDAKREG